MSTVPGWSQLFKQDFSSSSALSSYISGSNPNNGQFNAISTTGPGVVLSIDQGWLRFARGSSNTASYSRTSDFSGPPTSLIYKFNIQVGGNSTATTTAAVFQVGSGFGTANSVENNSSLHSRVGINLGATPGTFSFRELGGSTNSSNLSGSQSITWVINNSGSTLAYLAPNGTYETVADDKWDLWAGTTKLFNEIAATTTTQTLTDLKFVFTTGSATIDIDNLIIDPIPSAPAVPSASGVSGGSITLNWPAVSGATEYRLDVDDNADFSSLLSNYNNVAVTGTSQVVSGLSPLTTYYARVRAVNFAGTGAYSPTLSQATGYASVDGTSLLQDFNNETADPANRVTDVPGWTSNNGEGADGFVTVNNDTNNVAAYIGAYISDVPNPELAYQFDRGGSEKIVLIWEQQITESSEGFPGVDSFGWAFRNDSTTLFSLRFLPEKVSASDPGVDWDENGSISPVNELVAVAFLGDDLPADGPGAGPLDQVNFVTFERGQTLKFRVIIDLEAKSWSADYWKTETSGSSDWFGLVFDSALPVGTSNVDQMVALWDFRNKDLTDGLYQSAGDNLMLFDNLAITGADLARTPVTLTLAAPATPVTYDGLGKAATATVNPNVAFEISYWDTISTNSTTAAPVNAGTYTAKVTVVDEVTYAATPQYVTYTIAPKPVTVSNVSANNKEYDGNTSATLNTLGADIVGRVGIDDVNLAGSASGVFTDKNVGTNIPVTVTGFTLTGTAAGNYSLTQPIPDADITAKEVTVLGAVANSKTYDRTNTATINLTGATLNGVVSPDVVTVTGGGTFVSIDAGPMIPVTANLSLGGANAGNYTLSQPTYLAADIDALTLTIPDAQAQDKVYDGSTDAVITGTLTGVLEGDTVTVGGGGQFDSSDAGIGLAVTSWLFLEGDSAGNYSLTQPTGLTANIDPQPISVTLNPPASFTYDGISKDYFVDSPGAIADVTYEGRNPTEYGPTPSAPVNAGNYTVTATVSDPNYSGTATANFTIDPAALTVTADPQSKIYGETDPVFLSYTLGGSGTFGVDFPTGELVRDAGEDVGNYQINQGTLDFGSNYTVTYVEADLSITERELIISAEPKTKTYGDADPELTYTSFGLVGGDSITGNLARDGGNDVGDYTIIQGDVSAGSNYTIVYNNALLTIEARQLNITASAKSKTYGDADPELTYTTSGLVEGDTVTGSLERIEGEDVGVYPINFGTLAASLNYWVNFTGADLTINAKAVTVTADAKSKTYGEPDPELTYSVDGLVGNDTLLGSLERDPNEDAGVYAINQGTLGSLNYDITFVSADFTINKANQTITFPTLTSGIVGGSTTLTASSSSGLTVSYASSDTSKATVIGNTLSFVGAGSVTITASQEGNNNYNAASDVSQTITVASADGPWDIWADSYSMANGTERAKNSDPDGDGFVNALEFAFGTHPKSRNAEVFVSHTKVGTNYVVTFKKRKDTNEVTYDIRSSSDLKLAFTNGSTMNLGTATGVDANYEQNSVNLPISTTPGSRGFVRMKATVLVNPSR